MEKTFSNVLVFPPTQGYFESWPCIKWLLQAQYAVIALVLGEIVGVALDFDGSEDLVLLLYQEAVS